jgi:protein-S-isoprenylcysteine O-methyltransferase Ste14
LVVAIAEIVTILASANPSSHLSKPILSLIVWSDGKPDNLRMSNTAAIGLTLMVSGTWIRLMTYRHLGRFFRFEASIQKDHELIVSGPYSVVRHPSYTGLMLVFIGWFPWQMSKGSWVMESGLWDTLLGRTLVVIYISIAIFVTSFLVLERMSKEDMALRNQFGTKWDDWAKSVPYSIFPGIY